MATYHTKRKEDGERIAFLQLDGWDQNTGWDWKNREPIGWPRTTVDGIVNLFGGPKAEIPDYLGWHIAALMEYWVSHDMTRKTQIEIAQRWHLAGLKLYEIWKSEGRPSGN